MKKSAVAIIAMLLAVLIAVSLCACSNSNTKEVPQETTSTTNTIEDVATGIASAVEESVGNAIDSAKEKREDGTTIASSEATNGIDPGIVGAWSYADASLVKYRFEFLEDGTGVYDAAGQATKFTYTAANGEVCILYDGNTAPFVSEYVVKENTLTLIDSGGNPVKYTRN